MAERVSFVCAGCQSRLGASVRFAGRACRCPRCGRPVKIPTPRRVDRPAALVLDLPYQRASRRTDERPAVILRYRG